MNSSPMLTSTAAPEPETGSSAAVTGAAGVAGSSPPAPKKAANSPARTNGAANDSTQPIQRPTGARRRRARASTSSVQPISDSSNSPTTARTPQPPSICVPIARSRVGALASSGAAPSARVALSSP